MDYIDILSDTISNDQQSDDNSKTNESIASSRCGSATSSNNNNNKYSYNNTNNNSNNINKSQRKKRVRTIFTPEQLAVLEQEFSQQIYLVGDGRVLLAKMLNLTEAQVKVWFQNRRIKHRKDRFIKRALGMNEQSVGRQMAHHHQ